MSNQMEATMARPNAKDFENIFAYQFALIRYEKSLLDVEPVFEKLEETFRNHGRTSQRMVWTWRVDDMPRSKFFTRKEAVADYERWKEQVSR